MKAREEPQPPPASELEELREAHARLHERLRRRTAELTQANERLRKQQVRCEQTERELETSRRSIRMRSHCSQALVRTADEHELLRETCRNLVELGGYRLAWVGFAEQDQDKTVRPVAQMGYEDGYLETLNLTWADSERGRGPTGTAIRTGQPSIARNIPTDPRFAPWREAAARRGYASSVALPLSADGQVFGALNVYSAQPDAFDAEELQLLTELADDLAFGIDALRTRIQRRKIEEKLYQAQRMEAVGTLTGGIAHDFNNLLTVILGNLDLVFRLFPGDPELKKYLVPARDAGRRGAELVERLLAFARQQTLQPRVVDLHRLLPAMSVLLRRTLGETIEVDVQSAEGLWRSLIDPSQLEAALLHLAINARDAMPEGGRLTIRLANVRLGESDALEHPDARPGEYLRVAVSDTGTGMSPEVMAHAFEPFFTTKDVGEGSGLGLSMVYGFVRQSGGFVRLTSTLGRGTQVELYLPRAEKPVVIRAPVPAPKRPTGGETILVVEDEPAVRQVVVTLLADLGYKVLAASTGPEALSVLEQEAPVDLLFTDLVMPGGTTGIQLAREARCRQPHLKVLFGTGYGKNVPDQEAIPMVRKPYRLEELEQTVRSILSEAPR